MPQLIDPVRYPKYSNGMIWRLPPAAKNPYSPTAVEKELPWDVAECWVGGGTGAISKGGYNAASDLLVFNGDWVFGVPNWVKASTLKVSGQFNTGRDALENWVQQNGKPGHTFFAIPNAWGSVPNKPCAANIIPNLGHGQYDAHTQQVTFTPLVPGSQNVAVSLLNAQLAQGNTVQYKGGQLQFGPAKSASQADIDNMTKMLQTAGFTETQAKALAQAYLSKIDAVAAASLLTAMAMQCGSNKSICQKLIQDGSLCSKQLSALSPSDLQAVLAKPNICDAAASISKPTTSTSTSTSTKVVVVGVVAASAYVLYRIGKKGRR